MNGTLASLLQRIRERRGSVLFLTGAGISAESGVPTFRGPDGHWVVGSKNYQPQELATHAAFERDPELLWSWYLYRLTQCRKTRPNVAHQALVKAARVLEERCWLVTQNVDGLHRRAGHPAARMYEIHGDLELCRCTGACPGTRPLPALPPHIDNDGRLSDAERKALRCEQCQAPLRPHVLWFDEYYDEELFRLESSLQAARRCHLLVIVGTTGATTLPRRITLEALRAGADLVVINWGKSEFMDLAHQLPNAVALDGTAGQHVPPLVQAIVEPALSERA